MLISAYYCRFLQNHSPHSQSCCLQSLAHDNPSSNWQPAEEEIRKETITAILARAETNSPCPAFPPEAAWICLVLTKF